MRTLAVLKLLPEPEALEDLVARTMTRIHQSRQIDALIAREQIGHSGSRSTFTLRDALAMAASFVIVASLAVFYILSIRHEQQIRNCEANLGQIGYALQGYAKQNNDRLPSAAGQGPRWLPGPGGTASNSSALYRLVGGGFAAPTVFVCPATPENQSFHTSAGMTDFPNARTIHYSYQHMIGHALCLSDPALQGCQSAMVILGDANPLYRNGTFDAHDAATAASENHGRTGQNVLYMDMHVKWVTTPNAGVNGCNIYVLPGICDYRGDKKPADPTDTFLLPAFAAK